MQDAWIKARRWLLLPLLIIGLARCGGSAATPTPEAPSTDIARLGKVINLPAPPATAVWEARNPAGASNSRAPGPSDIVVNAVLTFAPADLAALEQQAQPSTMPLFWQAADFQTWYPADVRQSFAETASGFELRVPLYDASPLFTRGTGLQGSFFITPAGTVVVIVFSM